MLPAQTTIRRGADVLVLGGWPYSAYPDGMIKAGVYVDATLTTADRTCDGVVSISANRAGLLSLANILSDLANEEPGAHIHLDENNSLEDGSAELVIERVD